MKALIIGAGGIAHYHIEALQKIGVTICGIYDIDQKKAEALSSQYKLKLLGIRRKCFRKQIWYIC